jgi:hypothetical protein
MEFDGNSRLSDDASPMQDADDDVTNECKKRSRVADDWDDLFQKKKSSAIHRTVTTEEDDEFLATLLSEVSVTTSNSLVNSKQGAPDALPPQVPVEIVSKHQTGVIGAGGQVSTMILREGSAPGFDLKIHSDAASIQQPQHVPFPMKIESGLQNLHPEILVERWTCDVCKSYSFATFEEAENHETQCKILHDAKTNLDDNELKARISEGWTCDVCKSCSFATLEEAEIHETQCKILHDAKQKLGDEQLDEQMTEGWICDVCKSCSFATFEEAENHETQCNIFHDAKQKSEDEDLKAQMTEAADVLTSLAYCQPIQQESGEDFADSKLPAKRHPTINLVPHGESSPILSDYNNLLIRNIEFYYPSSDNRVGLRCIHCKDHPQHVTAATFFPSTIGSISSGLGTIGARHFGWGKCPFIQPETVQQMMETKKISGLQTRTNGRVGLDAYCKNLAKQYGIVDDETSGISWIEGTAPSADAADKIYQRNATTTSLDSSSSLVQSNDVADSDSIASVLASMKTSVNIETRPFVPSDTEHFWECSVCRSIPFDFRAKGSVLFSVEEPPAGKIEQHLRNCTGAKPLAIPHSASIEPYYGEGIPTIKVKWSSNQSQRLNKLDNISVKAGVDDGKLCFQDDQQYTTEFAYFTVMQLKKCYLTKAGGSRGTCPVGFAGLACCHCAGRLCLIYFPLLISAITTPLTRAISSNRTTQRKTILLYLC